MTAAILVPTTGMAAATPAPARMLADHGDHKDYAHGYDHNGYGHPGYYGGGIGLGLGLGILL
ncbi:hypothetical protein [Streptomyces sp. NPDC002104]